MFVMKFGGTSVGDAQRIRTLVSLVRAREAEKPLVVVSAQSGITDHLLDAGRRVGRVGKSARASQRRGDPAAFFRKRCRDTAQALEIDPKPTDQLADDLARVLDGVAMLGDASPRALDTVASFGERAGVRLVAAALQAAGVRATPVDAFQAGLVTDDRFQAARPLPEHKTKLREALKKTPGVPVITGFLGRTRQGAITTLGRGGSDYTAALVGRAVGATVVEIWTDVDGVFTADPRVVPKARLIERLSFQEAAELASFGAKVLHPATLQPAREANIPVHVRNTFRPEAPGTAILPDRDFADLRPCVRGMAWKHKQTLITARADAMLGAPGFLAALFEPFARYDLEVDMVATSEVSVSFTVGVDGAHPGLRAVLKHLEGDRRFRPELEVQEGRTVICLVGRKMRAAQGVAAEAFEAVRQAGAAIEMISQGASRVNLSFVIESAHAERVIASLHHRLFEGEAAENRDAGFLSDGGRS